MGIFDGPLDDPQANMALGGYFLEQWNEEEEEEERLAEARASGPRLYQDVLGHWYTREEFKRVWGHYPGECRQGLLG